MSPRPKHAKPDDNQPAVIKELRDDGYVVIVTASLPGHQIYNPLDFFVMHPDQGRWLQVELKPDFRADFTDNESLYLAKWGVWPCPFNICRGVPIVAAACAEDVRMALGEMEGW